VIAEPKNVIWTEEPGVVVVLENTNTSEYYRYVTEAWYQKDLLSGAVVVGQSPGGRGRVPVVAVRDV
jgi:hypothetical protein